MKNRRLFVYLFVFICFLCGCSAKEDDNESSSNVIKEENVQVSGTENVVSNVVSNVVETNWESSFIKLSIESTNSLFYPTNERIYVIEAQPNQEERKTNYYYSFYDQDARKSEKIQLSMEGEYQLNDFVMGADESILLLAQSQQNPNTAQGSLLMKFNAQGNLLFSVDVGIYVPDLIQPNFKDLVESPNGEIYFLESIESKIICLNSEGALLHVIDGLEHYISSLVSIGEDKLYSLGVKEDKHYLWRVDTKTGSIETDGVEITNPDVQAVINGENTDLLIKSSKGLSNYSFDNGIVEPMIDWETAGVSFLDIKEIGFLSSNTFAVITQVFRDRLHTEVAIFQKSQEPIRKEILTLVTLEPSPELQSQVVSFNKYNKKYIVEVKNYFDASAADMSKEDAMKRLQADLIAGTAGDIIDLESLDEVATRRSYVSKGLLEDLYAWMEKDTSFDKGDFLENVFKANEIEGKLYNFVPLFDIYTVIGKTSDVGEGYHWTIDQMNQLYQLNAQATLLINLDQREFLDYVSAFTCNQFIDWENGRCTFDLKEFVPYLEMAKNLPDQLDASIDVNDLIYNGQTLLYSSTGFNKTLVDYLLAESLFQEQTSLIGFPTPKSQGSAFHNVVSLGICSVSNNKEGAWAFLKSFTLDAYLEQLDSTGAFWFRKDFIEQNFENVSKDENLANSSIGNEESGWQVSLQPPTKSEVDKLREWMYSIQEIYEVDPIIRDILFEEAESYFAGQKSVQDVANMIQNRISLYLKESK